MKLDYRIKILAVLVGLSSFVGCISKSDRMLRNIKLPDGAEVRYVEKAWYFLPDGYDVTLGRFTIGKNWDYHGTISGLPKRDSIGIYFQIPKDQKKLFLNDNTSISLSLKTGNEEFLFSPKHDELIVTTSGPHGYGYYAIYYMEWIDAFTSMRKKEVTITVRYRFEGENSGGSPPAEAELHIRSGGFK